MTKITRRKAGNVVEVPIDEVWDTICKVLRISRLLTQAGPESNKYQYARLCFLSERLSDLEGLSFHYKRNAFSSNLAEQFLPEPTSDS